ncbi:hypothetical protein [Paenibacillus elgii]|uniref:hypothetical protein n=1 Tax=Paenibacillus elgii TaxID=189691 RepID=UPI0013CFB5DA|nr:hypothetical protein [Paenibacillus elgii]
MKYLVKYSKINENVDEKELFKTLKRFYIAIRSLQVLEQPIPKEIQEKIIQLAILIDHNPDSYSRTDISYLYHLILSTDRKKQESVNEILNKIIRCINELKSQNGFKSNKMTEYPAIYSTYMGYSVLKKTDKWDNVKKEEIKRFLESAISRDSIAAVRSNYQNLELGDLYYATLLSSMYKE